MKVLSRCIKNYFAYLSMACFALLLTSCNSGGSNGESEGGADPVALWSHQVGASGGMTSSTANAAIDALGNNYVVGYTTVGISGNKQHGKGDYFIAKYDKTGRWQWTKQAGASDGETRATGVATDSSGNSYVVGFTNVAISSSQEQQGTSDYFIAKYDIKGQLLWTKQLGVKGASTRAYALAIDSRGNLYLTGLTNGDISGNGHQGRDDYFIAKYNQSGNSEWTQQFSAKEGFDGATGIALDAGGNIYVVGGVDIDRSSNVSYFVAKHDNNGRLQWVNQLNAQVELGSMTPPGIAADVIGNVYVAGHTSLGLRGNLQQGYKDYFLAKYTSDGKLERIAQVGANGGSARATGLAIDAYGNSYVTGYTTVGISGNKQYGNYDYFVAKYDSDGKLNWTRQYGFKGGYSHAHGIAVHDRDSYSITGYTNVKISGNMQEGIFDYFIAKY